jgi:uncharacterized membrane protein
MRFRLALLAATTADALVAATPATAAAAPAGPTPGAPGAGDPYFPLQGNGGYDVRDYGLDLRYDPATRQSTPFEAPTSPVDVSRFETEACFATSKDGTRVPFFMTAKKALARDGRNPTMLYGYGGFSISVTPTYRADVPAWEILAHRIAWSLPVLLLLTAVVGGWRDVGRVLRDRKLVLTLLASSLFLAVNWLLYIYSTVAGRVTEASLGYYMMPLVNAALATLFLGERLRPAHYPALALVAVGVSIPFLASGVPAIDLIDFRYPYADTAEDTPDKLSIDSLDAVGEATAELIVRLSGQ